MMFKRKNFSLAFTKPFAKMFKQFCWVGCLVFTVIKLQAQNNQIKHLPSDVLATKETVCLYNNLHKLLGKNVLFGHQDDLAYGVLWQYQKNRSDVKEVTGEYPAIYGWELGNLELNSTKSLDDVPFNQLKSMIVQGYEKGGINTISWHLNNPLNGKNAWAVTPGTVHSILPGGNKHHQYTIYLDRLARFLGSLKGKHGEGIPILFRPFHELTGNWFWWGQNVSTPQEFIQLWKFTVNYLRNKKNLHHLLYVYNTAEFSSKQQFLERYPGDEFVDIISFDAYQHANAFTNQGNEFIKQCTERITILNEIAAEKNKLPAFAETGYEAIPQNDWWTSVLLPIIKKQPLSYVMVWRNAGLMKNTGKMHYYAPYVGHSSAPDFINLFKDSSMIFEKKLKKINIYL